MTALPPVLILAGGKATRLNPVLPDVPKILAPVGGEPFLDILVGRLLRQGFTQVHFCLGVMADKVIDYLVRADIADLRVTASIEERPLGTGGAILNALSPVRGPRFFIMNGDSLIDFNPDTMLAHHDTAHDAPGGKPGVTILTTAVEDAARFGSVESADGRVTRFGEKSSSGPGRINAGVYLVDRAMLTGDWPDEAEISLERQMMPQWIARRCVSEYAVAAPLLDIGTPDSLAGAPAHLGNGGG